MTLPFLLLQWSGVEWSKRKEVKVGSSLIMTYERRDISFFLLEGGWEIMEMEGVALLRVVQGKSKSNRGVVLVCVCVWRKWKQTNR